MVDIIKQVTDANIDNDIAPRKSIRINFLAVNHVHYPLLPVRDPILNKQLLKYVIQKHRHLDIIDQPEVRIVQVGLYEIISAHFPLFAPGEHVVPQVAIERIPVQAIEVENSWDRCVFEHTEPEGAALEFLLLGDEPLFDGYFAEVNLKVSYLLSVNFAKRSEEKNQSS